MYFASPIWAKSLTKFNPQIQDFKRFLDVICKQREDSIILIFSIGCQILKIQLFQMALKTTEM